MTTNTCRPCFSKWTGPRVGWCQCSFFVHDLKLFFSCGFLGTASNRFETTSESGLLVKRQSQRWCRYSGSFFRNGLMAVIFPLHSLLGKEDFPFPTILGLATIYQVSQMLITGNLRLGRYAFGAQPEIAKWNLERRLAAKRKPDRKSVSPCWTCI